MTDKLIVSRSEIEALIKEQSYVIEHSDLYSDLVISIDDLRAILDKAEKSQVEPVAYRFRHVNDDYWRLTENKHIFIDDTKSELSWIYEPLYTSPPADKQDANYKRAVWESLEIAISNAKISSNPFEFLCNQIQSMHNTEFSVAKRNSDKQDAERYRTIRKSGNNMRVVFGKYPDGINIHASENHLCGTALDEAIDAAMKGE